MADERIIVQVELDSQEAEKRAAALEVAISSLSKQRTELNRRLKELQDAEKSLAAQRQTQIEIIRRLTAEGKANTDEGRAARQELHRLEQAYSSTQAEIRRTSVELVNVKNELTEARKEQRGFNRILQTTEGTLNRQRAELSVLTRQYDNFRVGVDGTARDLKDLENDINDLTDAIKEQEEGTQRFQRNVGNYAGSIREAFASAIPGAGNLTAALNGPLLAVTAVTAGIALAAKKLVDTQVILEGYRREVSQLTGATGSELDTLTAKIESAAQISKSLDFSEILRANTVAANLFNESQEEAADRFRELIATQADGGAAALSTFESVAGRFADLGFDLDKTLAAIALEAGNVGESGKGVEALAEAAVSLREATEPTREAIQGLGLDADEVFRLFQEDGFAAIQQILQQMGTLDERSPEVGAALADIFRGAGEDAGLAYLDIIANTNLSLDEVTAKAGTFSQQQLELAEANEKVNLELNRLLGGFDGFLTSLTILGQQILGSVLSGLNAVVGTLADWFGLSADDEILAQNQELNNYVLTLQNARGNQEQFNRTVEEITQKFPDFAAGIDLATASDEDLNRALDQTNTLLRANIALQEEFANIADAQEEVNEAFSDQFDTLLEANEALTLLQEGLEKVTGTEVTLKGDTFEERARNLLATTDELGIALGSELFGEVVFLQNALAGLENTTADLEEAEAGLASAQEEATKTAEVLAQSMIEQGVAIEKINDVLEQNSSQLRVNSERQLENIAAIERRRQIGQFLGKQLVQGLEYVKSLGNQTEATDELTEAEEKLNQTRRNRPADVFADDSIKALQEQLRELQDRRVRVSVNSEEFDQLEQQIERVKKQIENVNAEPVEPFSIDTLQDEFDELVAATDFIRETQEADNERIANQIERQKELFAIKGELIRTDLANNIITEQQANEQLNELRAEQIQFEIEQLEQGTLARIEKERELAELRAESKIEAKQRELEAEQKAVEVQRELQRVEIASNQARVDAVRSGADAIISAFGEESAAGKAATVAKKAAATIEVGINLQKQLANIELTSAQIAALIPPPAGIAASRAYAITNRIAAIAGAVAKLSSIAKFAEGGLTFDDTGKRYRYKGSTVSEKRTFASGGAVSRPTLGLIGEEGPEYVVPNWMLRDSRISPVVRRLEQIRKTGRQTNAKVQIPAFVDGGFTARAITAPVINEVNVQQGITAAISDMPNPVVFVDQINKGQETFNEVEVRASK